MPKSSTEAKAYINQMLNDGTSAEDLYSKLKAELYNLSNKVEQSTGDCLIGIPMALKEIEVMKKQALELKKTVQVFEKKLSQLEQETVISMRFIGSLDRIKNQMQYCDDLVNQSQKFIELGRMLQKMIVNDNPDIDTISVSIKKLSDMYERIKLIPRFNDSRKDIEAFSKKFMEQIVPLLISSYNTKDIENTLKYVDLYRKIGKLNEAIDLYYDSRVELFQTILREKLDNGTSRWLSVFYENLELFVTEENKWCNGIFNDDVLVIGLVKQLHITTYVWDRLSDLPINELIYKYNISKEACNALCEKYIVEHDKIQVMKNIYLDIYIPHQENYYNLELIEINNAFTKIFPIIDNDENFSFTVALQIIDDSVSNIFLLANSIVKHCFVFTNGSQIINSVRLVNEIFVRNINYLKQLLFILRKTSNVDMDYSSFEKKDYHDWGESNFQGALQFLELITKILKKIKQF
eukprot:TRINITY_DN2394_c0_g1_i2.p1 TRINITY_DN2394_c0_g1~~TRINITY_DN2394_c0_g1_i2.p1  ORF type:complete len:464 (-),score=94.54 TRINITY_DN2394_c0_g1_i2:651-2042(-)